MGRTVLITGAGGFIGSALAKSIVASGARRTLLLECSEQNLFELDRALAASTSVRVPILGDAGDAALLEDIFTSYHPEIIYHAAAFKHVPLAEHHPIAVIRNNTLATYTLALAAARHRAESLIMISTDKAADPSGVMGASKRVAEIALMALGGRETKMTSVRLGNVLESPGSVVPIFLEQISRGGPLTVSDPRAARYFLTLDHAVETILAAAGHGDRAGILAPRLGLRRKIIDLAKFLIRQAASQRLGQIRLVFTGLRPGEKLTERLLSKHETAHRCRDCGLDAIQSPRLTRKGLKLLMEHLGRGIGRRDLTSLLREFEKCLPGYSPSDTVRQLAVRGSK